MAAAAVKTPWIVRQWRRGWTKIPVVMACHVVTVPLLVFVIGRRIKKLFWTPPLPPAEKYRTIYTVMRPGDPRIARINHNSSIDGTSILPARFS